MTAKRWREVLVRVPVLACGLFSLLVGLSSAANGMGTPAKVGLVALWLALAALVMGRWVRETRDQRLPN